MRNRILLTFSWVLFFSLSAKHASAQLPAAPQEWEINVEGGADFRNPYDQVVSDVSYPAPIIGSKQATFAPAAAVTALLRIPALRAYYGLRLEGHYADLALDNLSGSTYTASALIDYKAFIFDMEGDCDCPTWQKDNFFKKAFFVEFGLGYARQHFTNESNDGKLDRNGVGYLARLGLSSRLKKQIDIYLAGGMHGIFAKEYAIGVHDFGIRPSLGVTWRPFYSRF